MKIITLKHVFLFDSPIARTDFEIASVLFTIFTLVYGIIILGGGGRIRKYKRKAVTILICSDQPSVMCTCIFSFASTCSTPNRNSFRD